MRSFGGGRAGGGGGMGGGTGGIMRTVVQRAIRSGAGAGAGGASAEPFSPSSNASTAVRNSNSRKSNNFNTNSSPNTSSALTLSSGNDSSGRQAFCSLIDLPASTWGHGSPSTLSDESDWECIDGNEDGRTTRAFHEDYLFGTVPSKVEVEHAVSAIQQVFGASSSRRNIVEEDLEMDWVEPSLHFKSSRKQVQPHGSDRVYDTFHLLQSEPSVQKMVKSLSSDEAVWNAVMNNEVVKELRGSITAAHKIDDEEDEEDEDSSKMDEDSSKMDEDDEDDKSKDSPIINSQPLKELLHWIAANAKARIARLIDGVMKLFELPNDSSKKGETADSLDYNLKASVLISVVVLLVVVVARSQSSRGRG
ncbi:uncharacterized protein LOC127245852 [Andrographis paniculata]|uniref:uncharacterized protein LOC127245852 n=1 Tax=Andrographis paniculata TaxID=175694 RepID=UPI0021E7B6FB|nr:uncharacterized protein LOC127245852 [Andrographis paniculata]